MLLGVGGSPISSSGQTFKLQVAGGGNSGCSSSLTYSDVTTSSTPVQYATVSGRTDGSALQASSSDPTDGTNPVVTQDYLQSNTNFTNNQSALTPGQDGEWEAALQISAASGPGVFCFQAVTGSGSALNTYTVFPQLGVHALAGQRLRGGKTLVSGTLSPLDTVSP